MRITIKELSERAGVKVPTIRYYERQGLLPEPVRTGTGQRRYGSVDVARLRFVRFGRGLGMEIGEIRALIEMVGEGNGEEIFVAAEAIAERAERMQALCVELRAVSAAIIDGEINEASAFDRLIAGEGTEAEEPAEARHALIPDAVEEAEDQARTPTAADAAEVAAPMEEEPLVEESASEVVIEGEGSETLLHKPKRKRNRARS